MASRCWRGSWNGSPNSKPPIWNPAKGIQGFAEALYKELGGKGIKAGLVGPGLTGADLPYPDIPADKQREMINQEKMLRAEDFAVAVRFMLTQPRGAVVTQLAMTERVKDE